MICLPDSYIQSTSFPQSDTLPGQHSLFPLLCWVEQVCCGAPVDAGIIQLARVEEESPRPYAVVGKVYALHNTVHQGLERLVDEPKGHDLIHHVLEVASGGRVGVSAADDDIVIGVKVAIQ